MLTKRESPLTIISAFLSCEFHHEVKIDLKLLEYFKKDTDSILFVDLIKRMIKEDPNQREICKKLIEHAALKSNFERLQIVGSLGGKCFFHGKCINEFLIKVIDKNQLHMEGFLGEGSDSWQKFLAKFSYLLEKPDICSSYIKLFLNQVIICSIFFDTF